VHREDEPLSPLGVYGQTKAAGDALVSTVPRHYVVRTSWVIGDGRNFVATMRSLAERGVDPAVVDDQVGRLSFAPDIAAGIAHLLAVGAPFGTYNLSSTGEPSTWADIARAVFAGVGADPERVTGVSTEAYFAGKPAAPRPRSSVLDLGKLEATGFRPRDQRAALEAYLRS
jgi:dTDP-4-dehydrorhamnose 3,5-epimerase